jgi:ankyrin repeat protein
MVDARDAESHTLLMQICARPYEHIPWQLASLLLENKADIHAVDSNNATLLMTVMRNPNATAEFMSFLLQGPHVTPEWVNARDNSGHTALSIAMRRCLGDCMRPLLEAKAELGSIPKADMDKITEHEYRLYRKHMLQALVDAGTDVSMFAVANQQLLVQAVRDSNLSLLSTLLRTNPPPNVNKPDDDNGDTVLHIAMSRHLEKVVTELLQLPIDVFSTVKDGFTALMKALAEPHVTRSFGKTAAEEDREISACLALVANHVLGLPATHGHTRKAGAAGDGDGDGETEEAVAKRRRV